MKSLKKVVFKIIIIFIAFLLLVSGAFFLYTSKYYNADKSEIAPIMESEFYSTRGKFSVLTPEIANGDGFIFYPGAKVEHSAYLPLLERLSQKGVTCVLVKMPFNLAILDSNAADDVYSQFPEVENWYIGGHSLGGAMASDYYASHQNDLQGLILLAAYIYGDIPVEETITIYGSEDQVLDRSKITYTENVYVISGGNHAQFGNYGEQSGDGNASISSKEQQNLTVEYILNFIHGENTILRE